MSHSQVNSHAPSPPKGGGGDSESVFTVALYIRVSTDRQAKEGDSLEEQENELKKFCEFKGYQYAWVVGEMLRQVSIEGISPKNRSYCEWHHQ